MRICDLVWWFILRVSPEVQVQMSAGTKDIKGLTELKSLLPKSLIQWKAAEKSSFMYLTWPKECDWHDILGLASPGQKNTCNFCPGLLWSHPKTQATTHRRLMWRFPQGKSNEGISQKPAPAYHLVSASAPDQVTLWCHHHQALLNCRYMSQINDVYYFNLLLWRWFMPIDTSNKSQNLTDKNRLEGRKLECMKNSQNWTFKLKPKEK